MIRWKESQTKTRVAGQHLCLSHIWSKRIDCGDCCPYFRAGGFHRSYGTSGPFLRSPVKASSSYDTSNPSLDIWTLRNYQKQETRPPEGCWHIFFPEEKKTATDPLPTRPVLWFLVKDHSCDLLNPLLVFHPGRRHLPLQKGTALSWQGWKEGRWCTARHLSVHAFCDQRHKAWGTEPSRTKRGGRGLQRRRLWGNELSPHQLITLNRSGMDIWCVPNVFTTEWSQQSNTCSPLSEVSASRVRLHHNTLCCLLLRIELRFKSWGRYFLHQNLKWHFPWNVQPSLRIGSLFSETV